MTEALVAGLLLGAVIGWARYWWARRPIVVEVNGRWTAARSNRHTHRNQTRYTHLPRPRHN